MEFYEFQMNIGEYIDSLDSIYNYSDPESKPYITDRSICYVFPVLEGTKYSNGKNKQNNDVWDWPVIKKEWIPEIKKYFLKYYNQRCRFLIDNMPPKESFKEHSLFLLKESLKLFLPYSENAKKLLKIVETY